MPPVKPIGAAEKHPRHGGETWTVQWIEAASFGDENDVGLKVGDRFRLEERNYKRMFLFPEKGTRLEAAGNKKIVFKRVSSNPDIFEAENVKLDEIDDLFNLYWAEGAKKPGFEDEAQLWRDTPTVSTAPGGSAGNRR